MYHGLTIPVKWPKMEKEDTVLSPVNGFLIFTTQQFVVEGQEAVFLCCRNGREVGIKLFELMDNYPDDEACRNYLENIRWPDGTACPRCGGIRISDITTRNQFACLEPECKYMFTVTSMTALHGTRISLKKWMIAVYLMCVSKKGISSVQLSEMLEIQQRSAWYLEHRIRNALRQATAPIQNVVEVDETWVGGRGNKTMVVGIIERGGRVVLQVLPNRSKKVLHEYILNHVDPGYPIFTDDWRGYWGLPNHNTVTHSKWEWAKDGDVHTNTIEGHWSLVKKAIRGTFHHVSAKHLPRYLNELAWRYNNRHRDRFDLTWATLLRADHIQYRELTA